MIKGYVSSEEESEEDGFYSDPLLKQDEFFRLPAFQVGENKSNFLSTLEYNKKIHVFLKTIEDDFFGDKIHVLEKLLSLGVSVDCFVESQQCTPLIKACSSGKCEIVQFLLEHGANPNLHKELFTPLMACCTETYIEENLKLNCAQLLFQHGAQINATDKYHTTALMYATGSQYKNLVDLLLRQSNINVNLQDKEGMTALFYAVARNNLELVKKLIDAGSDVTICDRNGRKAINIALLKEFYDVAKLLGYKEPKNECNLKSIKNRMMPDILSELPNAFGDGGFHSDVQSILKSLIPGLSENQKISLPSFLNSTENDLYKMGILIEYDRQKLLKCTIHQYHLKPWKKSSMPFFTSNDLDIQDVLKIMAALLKHLTIINASLNYLKCRVAKRINHKNEDLSVGRDLIITLINIYISIESLSKRLDEVLKHSKQIQICTPHDFIERSTDRKTCVVSKKNLWYGAITIFATYLFGHFKQQ